MKSFLVALTLVFILLPAQAVETWRTINFEPIRQVTYQIRMLDTTCSAVGVGPRLLITAKHCVDPTYVSELNKERNKTRPTQVANFILIEDDGARLGSAKTIRIGVDEDLALLETDVDINWIPIGELPPRDSYAFAVGYPGGMGEWVTVGFIQLLKDDLIYTSAPISYGNSGGGLFVIQDGYYVLVGVASIVLVSYSGIVTHVNGFVDTNKIRTFLGVT